MIRFRRILTSFLLVTLVPTGLAAQDREASPSTLETLSLEDVIQIGLENNYQIRLIRLDADIAANNDTPGNAGFLPILDATASRETSVENSQFELRNDTEPQQTEGARSTQTSAGLELTWTLFDGFRMFARQEELSALDEMGELNLQIEMESAVEQLVRGYIGMVRIFRQLEVLHEQVDVTRERVEIARTRRDLGVGSDYDLLEAETDLSADQAAVMQQERLLRTARIQLNEQMGVDATRMYRVEEEIVLNDRLNLQELYPGLQRGNRQLEQIRLEKRLAELELRQIRGERYPELEVFSGFRYNRTDGGGGFMRFNQTDGFHVGLTARLPLFDGFNLQRRIENASIQMRRSDLAMEQLHARLESILQQSWNDYQSALSMVELEQGNLRNAEERMEIALERYREGVISALELRESQRAYLAAESRLTDAMHATKVAETELLVLTGHLEQLAIEAP
ncbi:MAG: TolC family protein [Balneolaceae bacterium]